MSHNKMKTIKLASELMSFFFDLGINDLKLKVELINGNSIVSISGKKEGIEEEVIEKASKVLNTPRQMQVEEYYWELLGLMESAGELSLAGMLTDKADVSYNKGILSIKLYL